MKNYLFVTPFFPSPTSWRGAYCYDFVRALARKFELEVGVGEWNVVVFTEGDGSDYEINGITVHTFKTRYLPSNIFPFLFSWFNKRSFLKKVENVVGDRCRCTGDGSIFGCVEVCHCHTANFGVYAEALKHVNPKCKTLLHHHDLASFGLNMGRLRHCWLYNLYMFPVLRKLHETIDTHVFISEASRKSFLMAPDTNWTIFEDYKRQMRGLPYRSVKIKDSIILHNGVDKSIFNVEGRVKSVERENGRFVIGCIGHFNDGKDQMTLLRAVAILKLEGRMLRVRFVGSGPYLEGCKRYAKEHNIDAEFLTEMRHEKLPDFYRSLDLFVLPSYFEGFGCVFTEAHSCGVPFITCEGQGMEDILEVRSKNLECRVDNPWLCKPRDPEDLAKKIGAYISRVEHGEHVEQRLNEDQDIDKLVGKFVEQIL